MTLFTWKTNMNDRNMFVMRMAESGGAANGGIAVHLGTSVR